MAPDYVVAVDMGTKNLAVAGLAVAPCKLTYVRSHDVRSDDSAMIAVHVRKAFEAVRALIPEGATVCCVLENQYCSTKYQFGVMEVAGMCMAEATRLFGHEACKKYNSHQKFAYYGVKPGGRSRADYKSAADAFVRSRFLPAYPQDDGVMAQYLSAKKTDDMSDAVMMAAHEARIRVPAMQVHPSPQPPQQQKARPKRANGDRAAAASPPPPPVKAPRSRGGSSTDPIDLTSA